MCGRYVVTNPVTKTLKVVKKSIQVNEEDNYKNDEDEINKLQEEINNFAEEKETILKKTQSDNYKKFQKKFGLNNYSVDLLGNENFKTMSIF